MAEHKRRTWLWVLGWIFVFPIPLTILLLRTEKLSKTWRYALVAVLWIVILFPSLFGNSKTSKDIASANDSPAQEQAATNDEKSQTEKKAEEDTKKAEEAETEKKQEEVAKPETNVSNTTDADVKFVITFTMSSKNDNVLFFPSVFNDGNEQYSIYGADEDLNPKVHFVVDSNGKDTSSVDIKEGETHEVHVSIDGVSDYTYFIIDGENTVYQNEGKSWRNKGLRIKFVTGEHDSKDDPEPEKPKDIEEVLGAKLNDADAIAAMERYGKKEYPYGFKVHTIIGKIACEAKDENTWFLKYNVTITNEYGASRDTTVEANVTGTSSNPEVTYFYVYE